MELLNSTPFQADTMDMLDTQGQAVHLVVVKGSWLLEGQVLAPPDQAAPLLVQAQRRRLGDLTHDPLQQRLLEAVHKADDWVDWVAGDYVLPKPALDVLVAGHCHAPKGQAREQFDASLAVGDRQWWIRAHAPRCWQPASLLGWRIRYLGEVRSVPMHAAFSLGGQLNPECGPQKAFPTAASPEEQTRQCLLPWLEDPRAPILSPKDRPTPAGWNLWPSDAPHRRRHAGTFDEVWRQQRAPRPPSDFDLRFHNLAAPELQLSAVPAPGTRICLLNLSSRGRDEFTFPDLGFKLQAQTVCGHRASVIDLLADTLVIEPELGRYSITWRAAVRQGVGPGRLSLLHLSAQQAGHRPHATQVAS